MNTESISQRLLPSNLSTFTFPVSNTNVRTYTDEKGEPWFVAKDVCIALGYHMKANGDVNTTNAIRGLNPNEITTARISTKGGKATLISESGLYKLVMRSDKPEAKKFQDWVTKVVLPAIRKTGGYIAGQALGQSKWKDSSSSGDMIPITRRFSLKIS